jgi:hypothetical protein
MNRDRKWTLRVTVNVPPMKFERDTTLTEVRCGEIRLSDSGRSLDRAVAPEISLFGRALNSRPLERFYRTARAAGHVRDPGVRPIYDVVTVEGQHIITKSPSLRCDRDA